MKKKFLSIKKLKNKKPIVCLTAYSNNIAKILDRHCDIILVGDSLGNVLYGMKNTHKVSLDMMIRHAESVMLGVKKSLCVVDLPKNTYNDYINAKKNCREILKKTNCHAIKIENYKNNHQIIKKIVSSGIQVMGHIGYTPQYYSKFKVVGKTKKEETQLINDALKIEKAGAFSIVLECIPKNIAIKITNILKIPTIGIGSSKNCDGQILVTDDLIGISGFKPRFVKRYSNLNKIIAKVTEKYKKDVINKKFPKNSNSY